MYGIYITFWNKLYIARFYLQSNHISCKALNYPIISLWVKAKLQDACCPSGAVLGDREVYVLLKYLQSCQQKLHAFRSNTLLSELLKYQWNSTSGGFAETLQGTKTCSPCPTAMVSKSRDLQTGLSAMSYIDSFSGKVWKIFSYTSLSLQFCLMMTFPLNSELYSCSFPSHISRYSEGQDSAQTQGDPV